MPNQLLSVEAQELVLDLSAIDAGMLPLVGGKAANLGELIRAGLPVPPGICVTTEAYRQVSATALLDFDALAAAGPGNVRLVASQAREALMAAAIPPGLANAITEAYSRLGTSAPVAVRSSATAEDLPNASFAGQQDTYLHVIGAGPVLDAVRRCWASLWTDRAVVYRSTNGIDHRAVRLAVVIQRMVNAEVSGVLFTANPVSGRRRQAVIDASPGLGEAVVSGSVNPDHFVVDTGTRAIVERRLGDKRFEVRSLPGGGTQYVERPSSATRACLSDEQVRALAALGERVEAHYDAPQDTEWAIDGGGKLWLTQARPITTLFPLPPGARPQDLRVYFCFSVAQGLYRPITPMGMAAFRMASSTAARLFGIRVKDPHAGPPIFAEAGQRMFFDLTSVLRGRVGRTLLPRLLDVMEARSAGILRSLCDDPRLSLTRRSPMLFVRRVLRNALRLAIPLKIAEALLRPEAARARVEQAGKELAERLRPPVGAPALARLDFVERLLLNEIVTQIPRLVPVVVTGFAMLAWADKLLAGDTQPGDLQAVLRGLPHNVTTEMDLALWEMSNQIRNDESAARTLRETAPEDLARQFQLGTLHPLVQSILSQFLSTYGHRAVAEIDLGMPRWSDDPTHILGVLSNYLRLDNPELAPTSQFTRGAGTAEAMIETLTSHARRRGRLRALCVRFALRRTRQLAGLRETPKFYAVTVLAAARRELLNIGAELARLGSIHAPDDVFFLDLTEVRAALRDGRDLAELVRARRETYGLELRRRHIPNVLLSDGTEPEVRFAPNAETPRLAGTAASAGIVTGIARVILDPVGARLEPGEILVAPSTDPGWTPLFLTASGLVMEMGGANSHGAVVAREYGLPAVVGVPDATGRIATGQRITIDGAAGTVTVLA